MSAPISETSKYAKKGHAGKNAVFINGRICNMQDFRGTAQ